MKSRHRRSAHDGLIFTLAPSQAGSAWLIIRYDSAPCGAPAGGNQSLTLTKCHEERDNATFIVVLENTMERIRR